VARYTKNRHERFAVNRGPCAVNPTTANQDDAWNTKEPQQQKHQPVLCDFLHLHRDPGWIGRARFLVQRDFGRVEVTNVIYENYNGIPVRAKLLKPVDATEENPCGGCPHPRVPEQRETGDAYCIELARRALWSSASTPLAEATRACPMIQRTHIWTRPMAD